MQLSFEQENPNVQWDKSTQAVICQICSAGCQGAESLYSFKNKTNKQTEKKTETTGQTQGIKLYQRL